MSREHARRRLLLPILALALALAAAHAEAAGAMSWSDLPGAVSVTTETTTAEGLAGLLVRVFTGDKEFKSSYGGAMVSLDRQEAGWAPWTSASLKPGSYLVGVEAPGYYPLEIELNLAEKTLTTVVFTLKRMTGFLDPRLDPADASIVIDGKELARGLVELPTGRYRAIVRRFAYVEREVYFLIGDREITTLQVGLDKAPFKITDLSSRREAFDPRNVGILGTTELSFRVSSFGSGSLEILSPEGEPVARFDFPSFTDWNQAATWKGRSRDAAGSPLPDGDYLVRLRAKAAPALEGGSAATEETLEIKVAIDSSLIISPQGSAGAMPGLLLFPEPGATGTGQFSLQFGASASQTDGSGVLGSPVVDMGLSASFGKTGLGFSFLASTSSQGSGTASQEQLGMALSYRRSLMGRTGLAAKPGDPALGLFLRAAWAGSMVAPSILASGTAADAFSLELGLPFMAPVTTGEASLQLGLSPALLASLPPAGSPVVAPALRACAELVTRRLQAGLSAFAAPPSFQDLAAGDWSWAAAAEFRCILVPTPLTLSASAGARGTLSTDPVFRASMALGFMF